MSNERGTSILEFAAVLPMLLFIMFGIVELSRGWLTLNLVTTAAREGARVGTVSSGTAFPNPPTAVSRVNAILGSGAWTGNITCSTNPCAPDSIVTADITVKFQTVVPLLLPMLGSINVNETASMRYE